MAQSESRIHIIGRHAVSEALKRSPERASELLICGGSAALERLAGAAQQAGVRVRRVDAAHLDGLSQGAAHQGVALALSQAGYAGLGQVRESCRRAGAKALVVACAHIQDPHNLGAVIRSAAAAGAQGVIIPKDRSCPLTPAVAKAAAGALGAVPVARVGNLARAVEDLKSHGLWAVAAATKGSPPPWELDLNIPLVLLVGGEHKGVGPRLLKVCDLAVSLPLHSAVESLNASVAAGALLFEIVRQRSVAEPAG